MASSYETSLVILSLWLQLWNVLNASYTHMPLASCEDPVLTDLLSASWKILAQLDLRKNRNHNELTPHTARYNATELLINVSCLWSKTLNNNMDDQSAYFDEFSGKKYQGLRDYHLRSALTSFCLSSSNIPSHERSLLRDVKTIEENFNIVERDPAMILGRILARSPLIASYGADLYHAGYCLAVEGTIYKSLPTPFYKHASEKLMSESLHTKYMMPSLFLQRAIVCSNAMNAGKELPQTIRRSNTDEMLGMVTMKLESLKITLKIFSECFGVLLEDDKLSIHDLDHLRNWSDKCTERLNVELACVFGNHLNPIIYPRVLTIYNFWHLWDRRLETLGNKLYKCIKVFEAMVIGTILQKYPNENIQPSYDFLNTTVQDYLRENSEESPESCEAMLEMREFLRAERSPQHLAQFYGLYRTWGHPVVSPKAGIEKYMKLALARKTVSKLLPVQIRRIFMTKYSSWFKSTKGTYPEIDLNMHERGYNLVRELLLKNGSIQELNQNILSPDWDEIRFRKNVEIPKTFNLSEMVADKAVSPDRSALLMLCKKDRGGLYDATYRRGVLQWLLREPESCGDFLKRINDSSLTDDECIIGLYQKERELNEKPRMFSLMSHSMRNYIVTTEAMLSEDILPAFPGVTMTNSLLSLQKKIYSVSYQQAKNTGSSNFQTYKEVTVIVNIDFEKWNLNFRRETTFPLFEALGDLYGLENLYNRTYDIFENSIIYLADGSYKPQVSPNGTGFLLDPPCLYMGHLGGFEGLRQKGWTLFTDCGLELICMRHNCTFSIMGQGDNQVLILTWKTYMLDADRNVTREGKNRLSDQFNALMRDLIQTFGELGLPVKALETWSSENLFLYGKFPTLKGVPLAMSLKKICRAYYLANEEIMTLDCALATIQSNAMAACMSDVTSHVPYVIYKIQTMMALGAYAEYHVLLGHGAFSYDSDDNWKFTTSSGLKWRFNLGISLSLWKFLMVVSWFPKSIGGVSVATWFDFMMRGFPDKISMSFSWVRMLKDVVTDNSMRYALESIYQTYINPEKNFVLLVEDPCALNLVVPVDARAAMKQAVQELFEGLSDVRNDEFATLFQYNKEWEKLEMCNELCKADILHPRFLHDLMAASPGGYIDSVVSKVSKASTINKAALRSSSKNPGDKIERNEANMMKYLVWKTGPQNQYRSGIEIRCPTAQAREIRLRSWDKILEGVTVPFPLSFLEFQDCFAGHNDRPQCDGNFISVTLPEVFSDGDLSSIHTLGSAPPYLGSETKEKLSGDPNRQVFGKEPLISRPLRLLRVINWFVPEDSHSSNLIKTLLRSVTNLNPEDYISREMGITGSEAHRYRDQALKHGVMSATMYTLGSHMHISTDPWIKYTRGAENYTINYQAILCALQSLVGEYIFWCCSEKIPPAREYHFHESCIDCIESLSEEFHDLADDKASAFIKSGLGNPYLWVEESTLYYKYRDDPVFNLSIEDITDVEYGLLNDKRLILTEWVSNDICSDILGENLYGDLRLLDSKDYPRVMYKKLSVEELWEQIAVDLIARAGVNYTSKDTGRIAYLSSSRELAADDLMKCSPGALMGAAMFYTWEEKFGEIFSYDQTSIFPDTNPPTLSSSCAAAQANLRDIIRRVSVSAPHTLIIPRTSRSPESLIRFFWYKILMSEGIGCPQCIKNVCSMEIGSGWSLIKERRCSLGHHVISRRMLRIKSLTATEDRLLKDCVSKEIKEVVTIAKKCVNDRLSPGYTSAFKSTEQYSSSKIEPQGEPLLIKNMTWTPSLAVPTSSYARMHEMISVMRKEVGIPEFSEGIIFGDGLGDTSRILSEVFTQTSWMVLSMQDSEKAIPQSYPHVLIPRNPIPSSLLDYKTTKTMYNDITSMFFVERWTDRITGTFCWYEAEVKGNELTSVLKVLRMKRWDWFVGRVELRVSEIKEFLESLMARFKIAQIYWCNSLNISESEIFFIGGIGIPDRVILPIDGHWLKNRLQESCDDLYMKAGSLVYAEYLSSLETSDSVSQMLRRCDYWFSQVGITHFLSCKKLLTPVWWDLQTGKLPEKVKNLGANKTYFMYKSDCIALAARLIALSLSMIRDQRELRTEIEHKHLWRLIIKKAKNGMDISLRRGEFLDYGPDNLLIENYIPVIRKLNRKYDRWWNKMPDTIAFSNDLKSDALWISKMATMTPHYLPDPE